MSTFTERIRLIFDVDSNKATTGFGSFGKSVREAEGAMGKLRAGSTAIMQGLNQQAGLLAAGAGAALVAWAVKGAEKLSILAKTSIDLGKATALSTEEASRWVAVADDAGVSADQLQSSFGRVAKTLDSAAWQKYGIATRDASGQARDTNEILLDTFDVLAKTTNETERARIGNELFGKGYGTLAPLVGQTRDEYEKMLAAVSGGQVITDAEAAKAEKLRLAQDALSDALGDLTMALGSVVSAGAPAIETLATLTELATSGFAGIAGNDAESLSGPLKKFKVTVDSVGRSVAGASAGFERFRTDVHNARSTWDRLFAGKGPTSDLNLTKEAFAELAKTSPEDARLVYDSFVAIMHGADRGTESMKEAQRRYGLTGDAMKELERTLTESEVAFGSVEKAAQAQADALAEAEKAARGLLDAQNNLASGQLNVESALHAYQGALDNLNTTTDDATTIVDEHAVALTNAKQRALDMATALDEQRRKQAEAKDETWNAEDSTRAQIEALTTLATGLAPGSDLRIWLDQYIAQLKAIPSDVTTNVHTNVPSPLANPNYTPGASSSGGMVVHINLPPGSSPEDTVRAIKEYEARNGKGWRQ